MLTSGLILASLLTLTATLGGQTPADRRVVSVTGTLSTPRQLEATEARRAVLRVPDGFAVTVFADNLGGPRIIAAAPSGTVYVTRRDSGDVLVLRDTNGDGRADERRVVARLPDVHGIALHENRAYLVTITELHVADIAADGSLGAPRLVLDDLPDGGQHPNRTIAIDSAGWLYLSIGSSCNACVEPNDEHATMLRMRPDGSERTVYAKGLRNTIGFGWHPETGDFWGADHGTDWRGNDVPPEELNRIEEGRHYGWPFCYAEQRPDSALVATPEGATLADFCATTAPPTLTYTAHAAPMQLVFYTGASFPAEYRGDAFLTLRGSWNREPPVGYKVMRVRFEGGQPVAFEDFMTGFLVDGEEQFGRPVGLAEMPDGSLLVGEDGNSVIYRIAAESRR